MPSWLMARATSRACLSKSARKPEEREMLATLLHAGSGGPSGAFSSAPRGEAESRPRGGEPLAEGAARGRHRVTTPPAGQFASSRKASAAAWALLASTASASVASDTSVEWLCLRACAEITEARGRFGICGRLAVWGGGRECTPTPLGGYARAVSSARRRGCARAASSARR